MRLLITIAALLAMAPMAMADMHRFVTVQGFGSVDVVPDAAVVDLGVNHQARTAREAMDRVGQASGSIIAALQSLGIAEADIRTSNLSLNQVFDRRNNSNEPPRVVGFVASNRLSVHVQNVDQLGEVLDQSLEAGANTFNGIRFEISDPASAMDQSRRAAVADALERAAVYAQSAGVELGEIVEISESTPARSPGPMIRTESLQAASVPIAPGTQAVSAQIWLKIALR